MYMVTILQGPRMKAACIPDDEGEMAGNPMAVVLLLGMGVHSLSMGAGSLPRVKWVIRSVSRARARDALSVALECEDATCVHRLLVQVLDEVGLGGLLRPGR